MPVRWYIRIVLMCGCFWLIFLIPPLVSLGSLAGWLEGRLPSMPQMHWVIAGDVRLHLLPRPRLVLHDVRLESNQDAAMVHGSINEVHLVPHWQGLITQRWDDYRVELNTGQLHAFGVDWSDWVVDGTANHSIPVIYFKRLFIDYNPSGRMNQAEVIEASGRLEVNSRRVSLEWEGEWQHQSWRGHWHWQPGHEGNRQWEVSLRHGDHAWLIHGEKAALDDPQSPWKGAIKCQIEPKLGDPTPVAEASFLWHEYHVDMTNVMVHLPGKGVLQGTLGWQRAKDLVRPEWHLALRSDQLAEHHLESVAWEKVLADFFAGHHAYHVSPSWGSVLLDRLLLWLEIEGMVGDARIDWGGTSELPAKSWQWRGDGGLLTMETPIKLAMNDQSWTVSGTIERRTDTTIVARHHLEVEGVEWKDRWLPIDPVGWVSERSSVRPYRFSGELEWTPFSIHWNDGFLRVGDASLQHGFRWRFRPLHVPILYGSMEGSRWDLRRLRGMTEEEREKSLLWQWAKRVLTVEQDTTQLEASAKAKGWKSPEMVWHFYFKDGIAMAPYERLSGVVMFDGSQVLVGPLTLRDAGTDIKASFSWDHRSDVPLLEVKMEGDRLGLEYLGWLRNLWLGEAWTTKDALPSWPWPSIEGKLSATLASITKDGVALAENVSLLATMSDRTVRIQEAQADWSEGKVSYQGDIFLDPYGFQGAIKLADVLWNEALYRPAFPFIPWTSGRFSVSGGISAVGNRWSEWLDQLQLSIAYAGRGLSFPRWSPDRWIQEIGKWTEVPSKEQVFSGLRHDDGGLVSLDGQLVGKGKAMALRQATMSTAYTATSLAGTINPVQQTIDLQGAMAFSLPPIQKGYEPRSLTVPMSWQGSWLTAPLVLNHDTLRRQWYQSTEGASNDR